MSGSVSSAFASAAPDLQALGYTVLPLIPHDWASHAGRGKCPGEYRSGGWQGMSKWQRFRDSAPSTFELGLWSKAPGANIGVMMGTVARKDLHVVALDFDAKDPDALDTLLRAAPASPMSKRGMTGETRFYLAPKTLKSKPYDGPDGRLLDLLTGFDCRQTVVPPSIHPATGKPYVWLTGPVPADDLPVLTEDDLQALEEALEQCGWSRERVTVQRDRPTRPPADPDDIWSETKAAALANLSSWVPALDLYGCRPARGGYEAVATWRPSCTGRRIEERKRNLSIQRDGIKDFGTNDTYSAIDLVMAARECEQAEATDWLRERLGLKDEGVVIALDLGGPESETAPSVLAERTNGAAVVEKGGDPETTIRGGGPGETHGAAALPAHLLDCPGLVGDLAAWMTRTAPRPIPAANLLTALAVVGTAAGRRFCGPTEAGTVIYGLALAPSGSGKAHPIRAAQHIMRKAGLGRMVAPSSWMSGSALVQHLGRHPACLTLADEVGEFFAKLNGARASSHERAISGVLRELFGINWGSYTTPGWAGSNAAASVPPVIHAPAYSFIGYSVPEAVWEAMQGADVTNGMLNRFLLVPTVVADAELDDPESIFDVPDELVDRLRTIAEVGGPLASATMHGDMATEPLVRVPWADGKDGGAAALFRELRAHCRDHPSGEHLMKRSAEIAIRLATVRAIGRDAAKAAITLEDMDWARNIALFSAERMIHDAAAYMAETEWQQKALHVLRIIREAPGGVITRTGLYRRLNHKYKPVEVKAILEGLRETGQVVENSTRTGSRGPASTSYRAA